VVLSAVIRVMIQTVRNMDTGDVLDFVREKHVRSVRNIVRNKH
jgi:hypothetical protein